MNNITLKQGENTSIVTVGPRTLTLQPQCKDNNSKQILSSNILQEYGSATLKQSTVYCGTEKMS